MWTYGTTSDPDIGGNIGVCGRPRIWDQTQTSKYTQGDYPKTGYLKTNAKSKIVKDDYQEATAQRQSPKGDDPKTIENYRCPKGDIV